MRVHCHHCRLDTLEHVHRHYCRLDTLERVHSHNYRIDTPMRVHCHCCGQDTPMRVVIPVAITAIHLSKQGVSDLGYTQAHVSFRL